MRRGYRFQALLVLLGVLNEEAFWSVRLFRRVSVVRTFGLDSGVVW